MPDEDEPESELRPPGDKLRQLVHDANNHLSTVLACAELAGFETDPGELGRCLKQIGDSAQKVADLNREIYLVGVGLQEASAGAQTASSVAIAAPGDGVGTPGDSEKGALVLLVDDDDQVRDIAARILERAGFRVLSAAGGAEAVELLRSRKADVSLAVLDMVMPELSGAEVCEALRGVKPNLPVVFCSGVGDLSNSGFAVPAGATVLSKPYKPRELVQRIHDQLKSSPHP